MSPNAVRLVLVHGTRMSARFWDAYPALLADRLAGVELVTPDLPGHGSRVAETFTWQGALETVSAAVSGGPAGSTGSEDSGESAESAGSAESAESAESERVDVLVGHSLGGYVALDWAAHHPGRLAGLALLGASADPRSRLAVVYRGFAGLSTRVDHERLARAVNRVLVRIAPDLDVAAVVGGGGAYAALPSAWAAVMARCGPELLRDVDAPVLLVNGQLDQLGLHAKEFAAAAHAGATTVTVPRATHFAPVTHPEAVADALASFVSGLAPGLGLRP
ncbi:alpha/beta hydrolase [Arsenicicoccus piscis]|uniref:Lysophospholipase n=1 Tax=Arsenicicoccus piscis TaxID=673954 RepID=A0ABQ6HPH5_9MICO|nr:alpha/beta hydrolase [Arsenicicoccus piscis]MCH8629082.1 alpha/beta hydrolase [Arsenicicoccus piscis]GMA20366.1 lysophospholipase [Arsenicicoccus piscis]